MLKFSEYPDSELLYLSRQDVTECCKYINICDVVERTLRHHAMGDTILPEEAYLGWQTASGDAARSLVMQGGVRQAGQLVLGAKMINGSLGNPAKGIARSQGLLTLFDAEIAWPHTVMESGYISAMRTAAVTVVSARHLGPRPIRNVALIGCGTLARANAALLCEELVGLESVRLFDTVPERASLLARDIREDSRTAEMSVTVCANPQECVRGAELVVSVTTVTRGYLRYDWFLPGALISHLSLDDVLPEVVQQAALVVIDDWGLVSQDNRRLLGRMYRSGALRGPDGQYHSGVRPEPSARKVDATLGDIVVGTHPGRTAADSVILCNPFGMSILDVALGDTVAAIANAHGIGRRIPR